MAGDADWAQRGVFRKPINTNRVIARKLNVRLVVLLCRKMLELYGLHPAYRYAISLREARPGSDDYKQSAFYVKKALDALGLHVWPTNYDFRDMEHYLAAFEETQLMGHATARAGDTPIAAIARLLAREVAGSAMMAVSVGYTAAKAYCQAYDLPIEYFNGLKTTAPDAKEAAAGVLGAADGVAQGLPGGAVVRPQALVDRDEAERLDRLQKRQREPWQKAPAKKPGKK